MFFQQTFIQDLNINLIFHECDPLTTIGSTLSLELHAALPLNACWNAFIPHIPTGHKQSRLLSFSSFGQPKQLIHLQTSHYSYSVNSDHWRRHNKGNC